MNLVKQSSSCPTERTKGVRKYEMSELNGLVAQFRQGNKKAFAGIWQITAPFVMRIMKKGIDKNTAEDLTGDVCIKLFEDGLKQFDPERTSFFGWLYTIATNIKFDFLKREKPLLFSDIRKLTDENKTLRIPAVMEQKRSDAKSPLTILIEREENNIRQKALDLLPILMNRLTPEEQYILYATFYDNRTDKEISLLLDGHINHEDKYQKMRERALRKLGRLFALGMIKI